MHRLDNKDPIAVPLSGTEDILKLEKPFRMLNSYSGYSSMHNSQSQMPTTPESDWWHLVPVSELKSKRCVKETKRETLRIPRYAVPPDNPRLALDIGGTLAKIAYIENESEDTALLHLVTFDKDHLDACLSFIKENIMCYPEMKKCPVIPATGVGCQMFREKILGTLYIQLATYEDEMECTTWGLDILWRHMSSEDLMYNESDKSGLNFHTSLRDSNMGPFVLVNMGSAMQIVLVGEDTKHKGVVGGSAFAGLSFLGLGKMLTEAESYDELVKLAEEGNSHNVDLLLRDTAGAGYNKIPPDSLVASFGKVAKNKGKKRYADADVASSLQLLVTDNLAAQSYFVAKCHDVKRAVFCGTYLGSNPSTVSQIKTKYDMMAFFLPYNIKPVFLRHEGHLGVLGILFKRDGPSVTNGDHK